MARVTAEQRAKKWANNTVANIDSYKNGITNTTVDPMARAAESQDLWAQGVQRAASNNKFAERCRSVSKAAWQRAAIDKGVARIADGVKQAAPVYLEFSRQHQQVCDASSAECAAMPQGKGEAAKQRMLHNFEKMSSFSFQRPTR